MGDPLSTSATGRPFGVKYSSAGSIPSIVVIVANKSGKEIGRDTTFAPSLSVAPMTWPARIPPPARTADQACG